MPELPEVETVRAGLENHISGHVIQSVSVNAPGLRFPFPHNLSQDMMGCHISGLVRRAKYLLVYLDCDQVLLIHLGMSGRITITDHTYESVKHDHLVFKTKQGAVVALNDARRFGIVDLFSVDDIENHKLLHALGPEPLGNDFSAPVLKAALDKKTLPIKQALLDQKIVAGLGNIYVCEALFEAGIHPERKAGTLKIKECEVLVQAVRSVLRRAIKAGGSTLRDYRHTDGELGYFQHQFSVYDRKGQACPGCHCDPEKTGGIERLVQSGRSTYFCPRKQK